MMSLYESLPVNATNGRRGSWFQCFSGTEFYVLDPREEDIHIEDIAHALSNLCRFNGQIKTFYSVAQHSVHVSHLVPAEMAFEGLLHDGSEAYLGDMVRPLKIHMKDYQEAEERLETILARKFGLRFPYPAEVKLADNVALMTEKRDLQAVQLAWTKLAEPDPKPLTPLGPGEAEKLFLDRYEELKKNR